MQNTRVIVSRYGGPEVLEVVEEPLRAPGQGEVRVRVQTAGVALADIMRREGKYPPSPTPPFTPGYDVVGIVDALGEGVVQYSIGDRVAVFFSGTGGYASYVYARLDELFPISDDLDAASAVAVLLNYVTAYQMLHRIAKVAPGERILIHGASGGVGTALMELGRLSNLSMFGTASLDKHDILARFDTVPMDYRHEDFVEVLRQKAPEGMDVVFDAIGGSNYDKSLHTLSKKGRFIGYGYTSILQQGEASEWSQSWQSLGGMKQTDGGNPVYLYSSTTLKKEHQDWFQKDVQYLLSLLAERKINPIISHRIPLREARRAHKLLEGSSVVGKVVLVNL